MTFRRKHITYVEGNQIQPCNAWKSWVEDYARRVAKLFQFDVGQHPQELVERLGGKISYQDLDEWIGENGSIFVHGEGDFDILLPHYTSPSRDRFTIAHELGHYYLHSNQGQTPLVAYRQGSSRIEWEANWFAASLLMPQEQFREALRKSPDLAVIATQFGVSQDAARVRKDAIGI